MKEFIIGGGIILACVIFLIAYCLVIAGARADRELEDMDQSAWLDDYNKKQSKTTNK